MSTSTSTPVTASTSASKKGFSVQRRIGIDMGHRVWTHGSKCRNIHGHRYEIVAQCGARDLTTVGEQSDMVMDFGFLKHLMMGWIDHYHDHGMTMDISDPWAANYVSDESLKYGLDYESGESGDMYKGTWDCLKDHVKEFGWAYLAPTRTQTKMMYVNFIPTAECLAKFWFDRIARNVSSINGQAALEHIVVWETPNCCAIYPS